MKYLIEIEADNLDDAVRAAKRASSTATINGERLALERGPGTMQSALEDLAEKNLESWNSTEVYGYALASFIEQLDSTYIKCPSLFNDWLDQVDTDYSCDTLHALKQAAYGDRAGDLLTLSAFSLEIEDPIL